MQNGVFILDPTEAYNNPVGIKNNIAQSINLIVYPNPANDKIGVHYTTNQTSQLELKNMFGQLVMKKKYTGSISETLDVKDLQSGTYVISIYEKDHVSNKKLVIAH